MRLEAVQPIDPGDEITHCYDPSADFLDLFERYGFFHSCSAVCTAELVVPRSALVREGDPEWLRRLVQQCAKEGCDEVLEAWWLPDCRAESSPLFAAVRAGFLSEGELPAEAASRDDWSFLKAPIREEAAARGRVVELIEAHLLGYATSLEEDERELGAALRRGEGAGAAEVSALRLLRFEKALLREQAALLSSATGHRGEMARLGPQWECGLIGGAKLSLVVCT